MGGRMMMRSSLVFSFIFFILGNEHRRMIMVVLS